MHHRMDHRVRKERGAEIAFAARPGPDGERLRPDRAESLPYRIDAGRGWTSPEDVSRHADGSLGDLAFLARFAFGRY